MSRQKIAFRVARDADGYPPVDVEGLWGETQDGVDFTIDSIPFFTAQATLGDVVQVREGDQGLEFVRVITKSHNSLIRVIVYKASIGRLPEIRSALVQLGCATEAFPDLLMIAVTIPPETSLSDVQAYLAELEANNVATYEEPILRSRSETT